MASIRSKTGVGFTLLEVLVASGVSLLLAITVFNIFTQSSRAIEGSTGRIELVQRTRIPLNRLVLYLSSAVGTPGLDSVYYPVVDNLPTALQPNERGGLVNEDDPTSWHRVVVFRTSEDFMDPAFDPDGIMDRDSLHNDFDVWQFDDQRLSDYVIWFEDDDNGLNLLPQQDKVLAIAALRDILVTEEPRDADWVTNWLTTADPTSEFEVGLEPQILGRQLEDVSFRRREFGAVQVSALAEQDTKTASGQAQRKSFRADAVVQIPTDLVNN